MYKPGWPDDKRLLQLINVIAFEHTGPDTFGIICLRRMTIMKQLTKIRADALEHTMRGNSMRGPSSRS